jgi:hypothetical protein
MAENLRRRWRCRSVGLAAIAITAQRAFLNAPPSKRGVGIELDVIRMTTPLARSVFN